MNAWVIAFMVIVIAALWCINREISGACWRLERILQCLREIREDVRKE